MLSFTTKDETGEGHIDPVPPPQPKVSIEVLQESANQVEQTTLQNQNNGSK